MAEFTLDEAYAKPLPKGQEGHVFSLDEAYGAPEEKKGFMANLKSPWKLWTEESLPANITKYLQNRPELQAKAFESQLEERSDKEILAKPEGHPSWLVAGAKKREAEREEKKLTFSKVVEGFKSDPGKFGADMVNALVADPYLMLAPIGLGGRLATAAGQAAAKVGPAAAAAGRMAGGATEAAALGAAIEAPISAARQLAETGRVDAGELGKEVGMTAAMSAPFGAAIRARGPRPEPIPADPRVDILERQLQQGAQLPVQQQINELLSVKTPEQRAAEAKARRADVKAAFRKPEEGSDFVDLDESIFRANERAAQGYEPSAEARLGGTTYEPGSSPASRYTVGQADILRIMQKPGFERTAEDLLTLRQANKESGKASPEALMLMTAAGLGGLVGSQLDEDAMRGAAVWGLMGGAAALPFAARGAGITQRRGQSGAVKGPGGNWSPEAVERLSQPLAESLGNLGRQATLGELDAAAQAAVKQSDRLVQNYLNKYAGTDRDPLKDIEVPFGEGTKRWEELMDAAIGNKQFFVRDYQKLTDGRQVGFEKMPPDEKVFSWGDVRRPEGNAVASYLSHVGDYLRQNVDPAKLSQYDLVRAVRETAANDARVAKQMEKAAQKATAELPVYKAYPDGFKWVELKLPEKLTPEQAKGVRKATTEEHRKGSAAYIAVDAEGKPLKNSYTQEVAAGATPEEAYLAGRLAEEGNQMGHCVGGYCEGVATGESKIYSLRDPKGKSHVTVETEPTKLKQRPYDMAPEAFEKWNAEQPDNISQIKGKQNRAPNEKYLPYVQDFVKGGEWGEVGDLGNTGLEHAPRADHPQLGVLRRKLEELYGPGEYYTKAQKDEAAKLSGSENFISQSQRGAIDQQLLMGLGAVGLGGLIGSQLTEEPGSGILMGSLAGAALAIPGARSRFQEALTGADYLGGVLSTRIANISPAVKHRAREFERVNLQRSHDLLNRSVPWMKALHELPAEQRNKLAQAVLTNDPAKISALQKGNPALVAGWREVRTVLSELGRDLQGFGRFKKMQEDYFPRLVKDFEGLKASLDQPVRSRLEAELEKAETAAIKSRGTPLSNIERSVIVNRELQSFGRAQGFQPGFAKKRSIDEVTAELQPFYYTPQESLFAYIRGAVQDIEMAKFFGRDLVQNEKSGAKYINVDQSIGNVVGRELQAGNIKPEQVRELENLLAARFKEGERGSSRLVAEVRNLTNMGLLGNTISAATQLGDVAMPIYAQGLRSTLTAMARYLGGRPRITAKDFGLADHLAEEFVGASKSAEALNKMFKYSGFSMVDRFGKGVMLNAALDRYTRLSRTEKGRAQIQEKYGKLFGADTDALVSDLRQGAITPNVRALLFSELSDFQPISRLEVPEGYLRNPNGRLIYMLKTFMIKQMDVVRRDAYNEIKQGRVAKGLSNLTKYSIVLGLGGMTADGVKNWLMGKDEDLEAGDVVENVLKTFAWSEYMRDQFKQSPTKALANAVLPPLQMFDQILTADPKAVQYIPLVGKLYYNWELGGREDAEIRQSRKDAQAGKDTVLSSRAERRKEEKAEQARERTLRKELGL